MEFQPKDYFFRIELHSEYEVFWIKYGILEMCPDAEVNFNINRNQNQHSTLSLTNCNLSLSQILFVFIENQISYEKISQLT